jgi:hypothetical protein
MPLPDFAVLSGVTIGELGMGIMLMRDGGGGLPALGEHFSDYFRCHAPREDVRKIYTRMVERNWVAVDPVDADHITVTTTGQDLMLASFTSLIRLVDEGHGALEISLLFSLASKRLPDDD